MLRLFLLVYRILILKLFVFVFEIFLFFIYIMNIIYILNYFDSLFWVLFKCFKRIKKYIKWIDKVFICFIFNINESYGNKLSIKEDFMVI